MKPTIGVAMCSIGTKTPDLFAQYVEPWWDAVRKVNRQPDQIIIAHYDPDTAGITKRPDWWPKEKLTLIPTKPGRPMNELMNLTFQKAETDWLMWIGLDDLILPEAFDELDEAHQAHADILVSGCLFSNGGQWMGRWDTSLLRTQPPIPSNSPIRRQTMIDAGGIDDCKYNDWAIWLRLAKHGAKPYQGTKYGMLYHHGERHPTISGTKSQGHHQGVQEIMDLATRIGWQF